MKYKSYIAIRIILTLIFVILLLVNCYNLEDIICFNNIIIFYFIIYVILNFITDIIFIGDDRI